MMDMARAIALLRQRDRSGAPVWEPGIVLGPALDDWLPVNCSGSTEQARRMGGAIYTVGSVVAVLRGGPAPIVIGMLDPGDPDNLGPAAPTEPADSGTSRFPALFSWTWESTQEVEPSPWEPWQRFPWRSDLQQGSAWPSPTPYRRGYWFYNWTVTSALSGATVDSARIRLPRSVGGPDSAAVTLSFREFFTVWPILAGDGGIDGNPVPGEPGVAGTAVTLVSAAIGRGGATWTDLPADSVQYMLTATPGPESYIPPPCIGILGADNVTLQGVQSDPQSGLLEITWHR